ncbi:UbiA family prenyltransferase [Herbivorax sp. ANBcel31]|uniref:UbiA family prenyltransferase n=1 Tax=Herbivorax sp. ANBcel31 TaxID=3069754 RepID=UPI0027B57323|nr:UbiA family prenyltransferase [Herbivorax sp. ANBcel31]MDQ2087522.1 UbiA family prenyltransferase [Herbivorax sp. ANBcel31]
MVRFIKEYVKSMRLYYGFVTGISGWLGVVYYEHITGGTLDFFRKLVILTILFLSWGINQIINDYLGLKEDRINAPLRPMVTGKLPYKKALATSGILLLITFLVFVFYLEPIAIIPVTLGIALNVLYEYAKGYGVLGNIVFGIMLSMPLAAGFLASGSLEYPYITKTLIGLIIIVAVINGVMTFYTYFKDYKGDREAGKKTVVVKYGIKKARKIGLLITVLPLFSFVLVYHLMFNYFIIDKTFVFLSIITVILQIWTGFLYYKYPEGEKAYYSLSFNFRTCSCSQAVLIALFNPQLGMMLYIVTYIFVGLLFDLHSNSKA